MGIGGRRSAIAALAVLLGAGVTAGRAQTAAPSPASAFDLYFIGHKIGREATSVSRDAAGAHFASTFHFEDRGTPIDLSATLDLDPQGQPVHLNVKGRNYRLFQSDSDVTISGATAHVRDLTTERDVALGGKPFFPIDNYAPIHVQQELLRYWVATGRPAEIASAPSGPIRIRRRGTRVAVAPESRGHQIERLSIDGAVWGSETAWFDASAGRLLAVTTWAGALPFQAIADGAALSLDDVLREAVADRIADLETLTRTVPAESGRYALAGATLIDGTNRPPVANATIVVADGRIESIRSGAPPRGVRTIDVAGRFVIPGLWDMHAHAGQVDWAPAYLASGVTTIRDMGGEEGFLKAIRDDIDAGKSLGPRYLLAGLIDGAGPRAFGAVQAATAGEAVAIVRRYHDERFNEIKIYIETPPALVPVITAEAHRLGMTVTGHVPRGMNAQQVVEAGYDGIAHMQLRGQPGSDAANQLIAFFKAHHTVMDPTMSWNELSGRPETMPLATLLPGADGLPAPLKRMFASMSPGRGSSQRAGLQLLKLARDAGLLVVPGTDKGVPGLSLPRELELYVEGGMTPLEAIQAGSIDSARAMRLDKEVGTIEPGKRADLLVLDADPLADIHNLRSASQVMSRGKLYQVADLWRAAGFDRK